MAQFLAHGLLLAILSVAARSIASAMGMAGAPPGPAHTDPGLGRLIRTAAIAADSRARFARSKRLPVTRTTQTHVNVKT
jgi:hypothetical protein